MTAMVLKLTDGTTTLNLNDGAQYGVPYDEWAPVVASRRPGQLGGRIYDDVVETIPLHVRGATAAAALANLAALAELMDQAERWARNEAVDAVRLQYKPANSSLTNPAEAVVLGGPTNEILQLSPRMNDFGNFEIPDIQLRLRRRGAWLGDAQTASAGSTVTNPAVAACAFSGAADLDSPLDVTLTFANISASFVVLDTPGFLLVADGTDRIVVADMLQKSPGANFDDSANHALNNNVVRVQASDATDFVRFADTDDLNFNADARRFVAFAALRAPAAGPSWEIYYQLSEDGGIPKFNSAIITYQGNDNPQIVNLGTVTTETAVNYIDLVAKASSSSSDYLAVDYVALMALDGNSAAIYVADQEDDVLIGTLKLLIEQRSLERIDPVVRLAGNGSKELPATFEGQRTLHNRTAQLRALWLAPTGTSWRQRYAGNNVTVNVAASRRPAYLVPQ